MRSDKTRQKNIKKRIRIIVAAVTLIACLLATPLSFAGKSVGALKDELGDVNDQIDDAKQQIKDGKAQISALTEEINNLEKKIYSTQIEINDLNIEINKTKEEIADAIGRLEAKQEEVNVQNDSLNARLRAMYKNGNAGMLSVIFGSQDMSDLLTNMEMIRRIYESDEEMLGMLEGQYAEIDAEKNNLQKLKNMLEDQQAEVQAKKDALAKDQASASAKRNEVAENNKELEAQVDQLNKEAAALTQQILKLQSTAAYVGGSMCWPSAASTKITSPFGMRLHPVLKVNKLHTGIDIGAGSGTGILAANGGKVISAGWNNSYGYMVMIDHGGGIVTLYAHSSKLLVSTGDVVTRGQTIALVGSTGMSTGPHLHFEVRVNGVYQNPLQAAYLGTIQ